MEAQQSIIIMQEINIILSLFQKAVLFQKEDIHMELLCRHRLHIGQDMYLKAGNQLLHRQFLQRIQLIQQYGKKQMMLYTQQNIILKMNQENMNLVKPELIKQQQDRV